MKIWWHIFLSNWQTLTVRRRHYTDRLQTMDWLNLARPSASVIHRVSLRDETLSHWQVSCFFLVIVQLSRKRLTDYRYYHHYLDILDEWYIPLHDVTIQEMYLFLSIILQMEDNQWIILKIYWLTLQQILQPFMEKQWHKTDFFFLHIMRFQHFSSNKNEPGKNNENWNWNMRTIHTHWYVC